MKKKTNKKKAGVKKPNKAARPKVSGVSAKSKTGLTPLGDRVLVMPHAPETVTSFGIIIPDTAKEKPEQGVVVAVGPGRRGKNGEFTPMGVRVGDKVLFRKYGYDEVKINGTEYYLLPEESIFGILN